MTIPWYLKHRVHGNSPWRVQAEAMRRSEGHARYAYFLEQGLGKTPLALNDFVHYDECDIMLNVVPNSFKLDWVLANDEWGVGHIPSGYWPKHKIPYDAEQATYAVNYEAVSRGHGVKAFQQLMRSRRVFLNIDESTALKNPTSMISKRVLDLARDATMVRELNGTPFTQSALDIFMQLKVLGKLDGVNPTNFRNRYAVFGGYMGKQLMRLDADGNPAIRHQDELFGIMADCSFRALKKDWRKDLPPQMPDTMVHLEMTAKQRMHYNEMLDEFLTVVDSVDVVAQLVLTQMMRLQQIASCLAQTGERWTWIEPPDKNPKVKALFDLIDGAPSKMAVVYVFKPSGEMLLERLRQEGLEPAILRGQMKPEELIEEKRRFNEDTNCRVILLQESAGFRGHTLIGAEGNDRCDRMAFYERSFSYYEYSQIRDRIHRGAQDHVCNYHQLITSPAEQNAVNIVQGKQDMANAIDAIVTAVRRKQWTA